MSLGVITLWSSQGLLTVWLTKSAKEGSLTLSGLLSIPSKIIHLNIPLYSTSFVRSGVSIRSIDSVRFLYGKSSPISNPRAEKERRTCPRRHQRHTLRIQHGSYSNCHQDSISRANYSLFSSERDDAALPNEYLTQVHATSEESGA